MIGIFKRKTLLKEYELLEEELHYKRIELGELFNKILTDKKRDTSTDPELIKKNNEINNKAMRYIELDKLLKGKRTKF